MGSIFSKSYSDLLERVHSSARRITTARHSEPNSQKTFADLLQTAEAAKLPKAEEKTLVPASPTKSVVDGAIFSNLSSAMPGRSAESVSYCQFQPSPATVDASQKLELGVKTYAASVKQQTALAEGLPPKVPRVKQARFTSEPPEVHSAKTAFPTDAIKDIISRAGQYHGMDPLLGMAVAKAESSFQVDAVSKDGHNSKGLFQLLDSTARTMMSDLGVEKRYQPFDPMMNSHLGVGYLRKLHDIFSASTNIGTGLSTFPARTSGDLEKLAVAAFNTGEGNVASAQRRASRLGKDPGSYDAVEPFLPSITRDYVKRVQSFYAAFTQQDHDEDFVG